MSFHYIKNSISTLKKYPWKAIYGRAKEIIKQHFSSSKKINAICVEEKRISSYNISIAAIVKNEAFYIQEWLEYHILLGVEHFFIYDNESDDDLHKKLSSYIEKGIVSYIYCPGAVMQIPVYNDAIARFKERSHWMAFIDIDEFIVLTPQYSKNLPAFLNSFEQYDMLGINWCVFDCNNHESRPTSGYVISNYTRCHADDNDPANKHIKCIVKPQSVKICTSPHYMYLKPGKLAVDENFKKLIAPFTPHVSINKIRINHYFTKSKEEYIFKLSRGRTSSPQKRTFNQYAYDFSYNAVRESEIDLSSFVNKLKMTIPETYR